jgi:hypothetical protein
MLRGDPAYILPAALQLAVEHVLQGPEYAERAREDGAFRQLLVDALYIVSRAWERDERRINLEDADIARALLERVEEKSRFDIDENLRRSLCGGRVSLDEIDMLQALLKRLKDKNVANSYTTLVRLVGERDTALVIGAVRRIVDLMCDFSMLRRELEASGSYSAVLLDIVTGIRPPLMLYIPSADPAVELPPQTYEFQFDPFGRPVADSPGALDETEALRANRLLRFFDAVQAGLRASDPDAPG